MILKNGFKKKSSIAKLWLIITFIGIGLVASVILLNTTRMKTRDEVRAGDLVRLKQALADYYKNSPVGYPASTGECLNQETGVGSALIGQKVISLVPLDPLWPAVFPKHINGIPSPSQTGNCYFYFSDHTDTYKISYFLETNSKIGRAGINLVSQ